MSETTELAAAITTRFGNKYLVGLTNPDDSVATTVDTDILYAACDDIIGCFELESGIDFDYANKTHLYVAVQGVMGQLESYKGRDSGLTSKRWTAFLGALSSMRKKIAALPSSSSMYDSYKEGEKTRPDMSRDRSAFTGKGSYQVKEIIE